MLKNFCSTHVLGKIQFQTRKDVDDFYNRNVEGTSTLTLLLCVCAHNLALLQWAPQKNDTNMEKVKQKLILFGIDAAATYFNRCLQDKTQFLCTYAVIVEQKGSCDKNLDSHWLHKHPYLVQISNKNAMKSLYPRRLLFSQFTKDFYGSCRMVLWNVLPCSKVERETMRQTVKYDAISLNRLMKYIDMLTSSMEKYWSPLTRQNYACVWGMFMQQYAFHRHFAVFERRNDSQYDSVLLSFTQFIGESTLGWDTHLKLIDFIFNVVRKSLENVVCIVWDSCMTNRKLASYSDCGLIGCSSHPFQLAVNAFIEIQGKDVTTIIDVVRELMKKHRMLNLSAKLSKHTHLKGKDNNVKGWRSTYDVLLRYSEIR